MAANQKKGSFWLGAMLGVLVGCIACAALALFITNAPIPFVEKVQKQSTPVDAAALDGKDPNTALYDSGTRGTPADDALSAIKTVEAPTAHQRADEPVNAAEQSTGESYVKVTVFKRVLSATQKTQKKFEPNWLSLLLKPMWLNQRTPASRFIAFSSVLLIRPEKPMNCSNA